MLPLSTPIDTPSQRHPVNIIQMAENSTSRSGTAPEDRTVIGLTFGNSNSSVAFTADGKAEVIANEDGGGHSWMQLEKEWLC